MPAVLANALTRYVDSKDPEAFRELVQQYQDMVYGTCHRVLGNSGDAERRRLAARLRSHDRAQRPQG
jgi:hypothetical protein